MQNDIGIDPAELRSLFLDESQRHLQTLNEGLLRLEQDPLDQATLNNVFRAAHTLKGIAATMGYDAITGISHAMEDILSDARVRPEHLTPLISLMLDSVDAIELLVSDVTAGGSAQGDVTATIGALRAAESTLSTDLVDAPVLSDAAASSACGDLEVEEAPVLPPSDSTTPSGDTPPAVAAESQRLPDRSSVLDAAKAFRVPRTVHLDVQHLDHLLDIVTEMVIHQGRLTRIERHGDLASLKEALSAHGRLLDELQDAVLDTRMVPIGQIFNRFPRMVHDLLQTQGKDAQLVIEGAQVELDRTILASVDDSLIHLLRNAVDHGIELPAEREAAGKGRRGTIRLSAYHERDTVVVEVDDDGRGIDARQIANVAIRQGIVTREDLADMSEAQVLELICVPGFSSNTEVTAVSGRGVGMDAVKRQIELMRGTLGIETRPGRGSTFRLRLPVNLALLDALLIVVSGEHYAVPASHVDRLLKIDPGTLTYVGEKILMSLPEGVLPLRSASGYLGAQTRSLLPGYALVMRRHNLPFAVGVDEVVGYEQIVAKPLPPALEAISCLSGVTILGDGDLAFIVDLAHA